jgi:hypothetical protein
MKPKKKGKKKGKKRSMAFLLLLLPVLSGCGTIDWITGADNPAVLNGVEESIVEQAASVAKHVLPAPWGLLVGAVIGAAAVLYRNYRKTKNTS